MTTYLRKISRSKWPNHTSNYNYNEVKADAVTSCLRTTANKLSIWKVDEKEDIDKAILAIISNMERPDTVDVIFINEELINKNNISIEEETGNTPFKDFADNHYNIINLTYASIGNVINIILETLQNMANYQRINSSEVKKRIKSAVENGEIEIDNLHKNMKKKLNLNSD